MLLFSCDSSLELAFRDKMLLKLCYILHNKSILLASAFLCDLRLVPIGADLTSYLYRLCCQYNNCHRYKLKYTSNHFSFWFSFKVSIIKVQKSLSQQCQNKLLNSIHTFTLNRHITHHVFQIFGIQIDDLFQDILIWLCCIDYHFTSFVVNFKGDIFYYVD